MCARWHGPSACAFAKALHRLAVRVQDGDGGADNWGAGGDDGGGGGFDDGGGFDGGDFGGGDE